MRITVLGITGYTGSAMISILSRHPEIEDIIPVSQSHPDEPLAELLPQLGCNVLEKIVSTAGATLSPAHAKKMNTDMLFSCLPHTASGEACAEYFGSCSVIDLSADFRFRDRSTYEKTYRHRATASPHDAVYGLAEWNRDEIRGAKLVAVPGCYATTCLLPLLPLARKGLLSSPVVIHAMSGVSGAGKKTSETFMFCERNESLRAYLPGSQHRHHAEIAEKISLESPESQTPTVYFNPHLVPMTRGISASITLTLKKDAHEGIAVLQKQYAHEPFVRVREELFPESSWVQGTNRVEIGLHAEENTLFISSVSDNLVKGAAGQAVQSMNIMRGIEEGTGLQY